MERRINKVGLLVAAIVGALTLSIASYSTEAESKVADITLMTDNTVVIDQEINAESVSQAIKEIIEAKGEVVNIFINSPGGSVFEGARLVDFLLTTTEKETNCIVQFAASMAFVITQACNNRLVLGSGVLMQHQASYGLRAAPMRNQESLIKLITSMTEELDQMQSKRMQIQLNQFQAMIAHDAWFTGRQAVAEGAVDRLVSVTCSQQLIDKEDSIDLSLFGVTVVFSECPLITTPVRIDKHKDADEKTIKEMVETLIPNYLELGSEEIKRINRG